MAEALRWAVCLILGVPSALLIPLNWLIVIEAMIEVAVGGRPAVSPLPHRICAESQGLSPASRALGPKFGLGFGCHRCLNRASSYCSPVRCCT